MFKKKLTKVLNEKHQHENKAIEQINFEEIDVEVKPQNKVSWVGVFVPVSIVLLVGAVVLPITLMNKTPVAEEKKVEQITNPNKEFNKGGTILPNYRQAVNDFAIDLLPHLYNGKDNMVCSPLSIATCTSMLLDGAKGDTRKELETLLHYDESKFDHLLSIKNMLNKTSVDVVNKKDKATSFLNVSQSFFLSDHAREYKQSYFDILQNNYYAEAYRGDLSTKEMQKLLVDWINNKTNNFLNLTTDDFKFPNDSYLWLVNALYMKATWNADHFNENKIYFTDINGKGEEVDSVFFVQNLTTIYENDDYYFLNIPLRDDFRYNVVLPKNNSELLSNPETFKLLLDETYRKNQLEEVYCTLTTNLPQYKETTKLDIVETYKAMGVSKVFDSSCDLSNIVDPTITPLSVGQIQHGAGIEVNEIGVEGAAYTTIMILENAMGDTYKHINININHPFAYSVTYDGLPIFTGIETVIKR